MPIKLFTLLFLCTVSFAIGEIQFDLSSYEPIEYRTVGLTFEPTLKSTYVNDHFYNQLGTKLSWAVRKNETLRYRMFGFINSISFNRSKLKDDETSVGNNTFLQGNHIASYQHKRYLRKERLFFDANIFVTYSPTFQWYSDSEFNLTQILQTNISLGIGYGKIKYVSHAAISLQAFRQFERDKTLLKSDKETIHNIAQTFERLSQERQWDQRESRIRQIKVITDQLYSEGITKELNPEQLMRLLDFWEYRYTQQRFDGYEIMLYAKLKDMTNFKGNNSISPSPRDLVHPAVHEESPVYLLLQYHLHRSPHLKVTRSLEVEASWGTTEDNRNYNAFTIKPEILFFPSFRSTISLSNSTSVYLNRYDDESSNRYELPNYVENITSVSLEYFVRPQLSYYGNWSGNFISEDEDDIGGSFKTRLSLGLTFHI